MKKLFFFNLVLVSICFKGYSQCDRPLFITSSKTEYLNANYIVQQSRPEKTIVEINKTDLVMTLHGNDEKLTGTIKSTSCNWNIPFKEGKTIIKVSLAMHGEEKNATITIEGKNNMVTYLVEIEGMPDQKMRLIADTFEQKS